MRKTTKSKKKSTKKMLKLLPVSLTNVRNCSDNPFPYGDGTLVTYIFFVNGTYSFLAPSSKPKKKAIKEAIEFSRDNNLDVLALWKGAYRTDVFIVDEKDLAIQSL